MIEAGNEWETVAMNEIGEEIYSTPSIDEGVLYVRSRDRLYSFRKQPSKPLDPAPASR